MEGIRQHRGCLERVSGVPGWSLVGVEEAGVCGQAPRVAKLGPAGRNVRNRVSSTCPGPGMLR